MLQVLLGPLVGLICIPLVIANYLFWLAVLMLVVVVRPLCFTVSLQRQLESIIHQLPPLWIDCNALILKLCVKVDWDVQGLDQLDKNQWYLLVANHQSWLDIPVLFHVFNRRIPLLVFFLKRQLIWIPFLGIACKVLGFPFVYRYTKSQIKKRPELKGRDTLVTKQACERYKNTPVTIINFLEGTRFTEQKHMSKKSIYQYLLPPKAGGAAYAIFVMGDCLQQIINVTIVYPDAKTNLLRFYCGLVRKIIVRVSVIPIEEAQRGDYQADPEFRIGFQQYVNALWQDKDEKIQALLEDSH